MIPARQFRVFLYVVCGLALYAPLTAGYDPATCIRCRQGQLCKPPACSCCRDEMPLPRKDIPQMVFFTFDDAVTPPVASYYRQLFDSSRRNPNGCPITMTLFISHKNTVYSLVREFYQKGMEIASHSVTHSHPSTSTFMNEAKKQKENLAKRARIPEHRILGWRSPFLEPLGDAQPEVLNKLGYKYDATLTVAKKHRQDMAPVPFTLDYGWPYDCKIKPCPTKKHKGFWEVPVVSVLDYLKRYDCVYVDGCNNPPPDEERAYQFLWDNFNTYYTTNRAPFGVNMHASWFYYPERKAAMNRFIKDLVKLDDVYIVSVKQVIDWLANPTPLSNIETFKPWQCNSRNHTRGRPQNENSAFAVRQQKIQQSLEERRRKQSLREQKKIVDQHNQWLQQRRSGQRLQTLAPTVAPPPPMMQMQETRSPWQRRVTGTVKQILPPPPPPRVRFWWVKSKQQKQQKARPSRPLIQPPPSMFRQTQRNSTRGRSAVTRQLQQQNTQKPAELLNSSRAVAAEKARQEKEQAKRLEQEKQAEKARLEKERLKELKRQEEIKKQQEQQRLKDLEIKKIAAAAAKLLKEKQRLDDLQKQEQLEQQRQVELAKQKELELQKQQELKRQRDAELKRQEDIQYQKDLEIHRQQEADLIRQEEVRKQKQLEQQKAADLKRKQDSEKQRQAEIQKQIDLENAKKAEAELKRQQDLLRQKEQERQQELENQRLAEIRKQKELDIALKAAAALQLQREQELERQRQVEINTQRQVDIARQAETKSKRKELARQQEQQRQSELSKQKELEKAKQAAAELKRQQDLVRQQDLERQAELQKQKELEKAKQAAAELKRQQELARKQELERQAELQKQKELEKAKQAAAELKRQQELARQQELERQAELQKQKELEKAKQAAAELKRQQELARQQELERQAELQKQKELEKAKQAAAELKRQQELARQQELERQAELQKQKELEKAKQAAAELKRQQELARQQELERQAELQKQKELEKAKQAAAELKRQQELARQQELERQAELQKQKELEKAKQAAAELKRQQELARQQELERQAELQKQKELEKAKQAAAELKRQQELARQQELERQAELQKQKELEKAKQAAAELKRQQELARQQELERQAELQKQKELEKAKQAAAELKRQQEMARQQELERQAELQKQKELEKAKQAASELKRQQEMARQAELQKQKELEKAKQATAELKRQHELAGQQTLQNHLVRISPRNESQRTSATRKDGTFMPRSVMSLIMQEVQAPPVTKRPKKLTRKPAKPFTVMSIFPKSSASKSMWHVGMTDFSAFGRPWNRLYQSTSSTKSTVATKKTVTSKPTTNSIVPGRKQSLANKPDSNTNLAITAHTPKPIIKTTSWMGTPRSFGHASTLHALHLGPKPMFSATQTTPRVPLNKGSQYKGIAFPDIDLPPPSRADHVISARQSTMWPSTAFSSIPQRVARCQQGVNCMAPSCRCKSVTAPNSMPTENVPQIVYITIDGNINFHSYAKLKGLFSRSRVNPNGCRIKGTFFASDSGTSYRIANLLNKAGVEIAMSGFSTAAYTDSTQMAQDIDNQISRISTTAAIPREEIRGWRSPLFRTLGDEQFEILGNRSLYDSTFLTDRSGVNKAKVWPFTMDFGWKEWCDAGQCPSRGHPGLWEVPVMHYQGPNSSRPCEYVDDCNVQPRSKEDTMKYLRKNFNQYYKTNRAPFAIRLKQIWFHWFYRANFNALIDFLDEILKLKDVYVTSVADTLEWMKNPTDLKSLNTFTPWQCS